MKKIYAPAGLIMKTKKHGDPVFDWHDKSDEGIILKEDFVLCIINNQIGNSQFKDYKDYKIFINKFFPSAANSDDKYGNGNTVRSNYPEKRSVSRCISELRAE
jgi:hypothetical protein